MLRATSLHSASVSTRSVVRAPARNLRSSAPRSAVQLHQLAEQAAEAVSKVGQVDAPIGVIIGAAVVITVAATALVPLALKPGDDAAQKIFSGQNLGKTTVKKPAPGSKAAGRK